MDFSTLLSQSRLINQDLKRNIVDVHPVSSSLSLLMDDEDSPDDAEAIVRNTRSRSNPKGTIDGFYYTAVEYPFLTEPYMISRYSDGSYPVWYGSQTIETTIYETVYHTKKWLLNIEGIEGDGIITRKRAVYDVFCNSVLLDVTGNEQYHSELIANTYDFTNALGEEARRLELNGILAPSARFPGGINAAVYKPSILSNPRLSKKLRYEFDAESTKVKVYSEDNVLMVI